MAGRIPRTRVWQITFGSDSWLKGWRLVGLCHWRDRQQLTGALHSSPQVDCGQALKECAEWLGEPSLVTTATQSLPRNQRVAVEATKLLPGEIYSPTQE